MIFDSSDPSPAIDSNTEKTLEKLNRELRQLGPLGKFLSKNNEFLAEQNKVKKEGQIRDHLLTDSLKRLTSALNISIAGQFVTSVKEFDTTQRVALGMNQTLATVIGANSTALENLPGSYKDAVMVQVEAFRMGFKTYNKDLIALGNRMKITGQNFQQLLSVMAHLRVTGLLSNEATGRLSRHLVETTEKHGISTELLVGAISNLGDSLESAAALGFTENLVNTQTKLVGMLSAGSEGLVTSVMKGITKADIGAEVTSWLGGPGTVAFRDALTSGKNFDVNQLNEMLQNVNTELKANFKALVGSDKMSRVNLGFWRQIMGETNFKMFLLSEKVVNLTDEEKKVNEKSEALNSSLQTLKDEVLEPIVVWGKDMVISASENLDKTKGLIAAIIVLTAVIKGTTLFKSIGGLGGGAAGVAAGGLKKFAALGIPLLATAATVGAYHYAASEERKRQTKLAKKSAADLADIAKLTAEEAARKKTTGGFIADTSNALRTALQMQAFMPEFASAAANNLNQRQLDDLIKEMTLTKIASQALLRELAGS